MTAQISRFDKIHGDEGYVEYTPAEQAAMEHRIEAKAKLLMADFDWWRECMGSFNQVSFVVEEQLPRMMASLDDACKLETRPELGHYAVQAILAGLHQIQRQAKMLAEEQARKSVEEGGE